MASFQKTFGSIAFTPIEYQKKQRLTPKILLALISSLHGIAFAQTVPTPGTVIDTVRPEKPTIPAPTPEKVITPPATPKAPNLDPNAPRVKITGFQITGNSVIATETLQALIADQAGKPYNLYELQKVTRILSDYYHSKGYPVAKAVIPAQKIESGTVTIEVIEGKIEKTQFLGNKLYSKPLLERWAAPLIGKTVQVEPLEERMLAINDLPGMSARAVLSPGSEYGTTVLEVETKEKPIDGQISLNNYGRKEIGEYRTDASVNFNNPIGIGDQLGIRASYSERSLLKMVGANYSLPVNIQGTRLAVNYTAVEYDIGGELGNLGINGKSELGGINVIHPFIRTPNQNLFGTAGVRYFNGRQFISDTEITKSSVKVAEMGLAWNRVNDNFDVTSAAMRVSTNYRSKVDAEYSSQQRYKLELDATHLWRVNKKWDLRFAASGQLASASLADAEKFSLGGPNSVRGYPAADVRGDRGAFGSGEVRYHPEFIKVPSYFSMFADGGYVRRTNPSPGTSLSTSIRSAGLGFNFLPVKSVQVEIAVAIPLSHLDPSDNRDKGRAWLNVTTNF